MDDVLSAVDSQVARHLVDSLLSDYLCNKTRILCTHHAYYLQSADWILVFENGRIVSQGSLTSFDFLLRMLSELTSGPPSEILPRFVDPEMASKEKKKTTATCSAEDEREAAIPSCEERNTGQLQFEVLVSYWKAVGIYLAPAILAALLFMQSSKNVSDWWLAHWVSELQNDTKTANRHTFQYVDARDSFYYLGIYGAIAGANTIFTFLRAFLFARGGLNAAQFMHSRLVDVILKVILNSKEVVEKFKNAYSAQANIIFFDSTPVGRILNRFSSDIYTIDDSLPFMLNIFLAQVYGLIGIHSRVTPLTELIYVCLGTIVVTCVGIPWISLLLLPLGFIYFHLQNYYRSTSRELKRLSTVTLSPIYSHFAETLSGLVTVRATKSTARFSQENLDKVENNIKTQFASQAAAQWLNLRLQLIGVAMVTGVGVFAVVQHHVHTVDPGLVGLAISYALTVTGVLSGVVTSFVETEKEMVSVERVHNYLESVPGEPANPPTTPPATWPSTGRIIFNHVSMKYR